MGVDPTQTATNLGRAALMWLCLSRAPFLLGTLASDLRGLGTNGWRLQVSGDHKQHRHRDCPYVL